MIPSTENTPASEGLLISLRKMAKTFAQHADKIGMPVSEDEDDPGEREIYELGLAALVFCDARRVFKELNAGGLSGLMEEAFDLVFDMPLEKQLDLKNQIKGQIDEISRLKLRAESASPPTHLPRPGGTAIDPKNRT